MTIGRLFGRGAFSDAINQLRNSQFAQKAVFNAYLPYFLTQAKLVF